MPLKTHPEVFKYKRKAYRAEIHLIAFQGEAWTQNLKAKPCPAAQNPACRTLGISDKFSQQE